MDSKDPDFCVLDGWTLATKTRPACTIHEEGMWLFLWLDENGHICKNLTPKWWTPDIARNAGEEEGPFPASYAAVCSKSLVASRLEIFFMGMGASELAAIKTTRQNEYRAQPLLTTFTPHSKTSLAIFETETGRQTEKTLLLFSFWSQPSAYTDGKWLSFSLLWLTDFCFELMSDSCTLSF